MNASDPGKGLYNGLPEMTLTKIRIHHRTVYRYTMPVGLGPHRLMLRPRESHELSLLSNQVTVDPDAEIVWSTRRKQQREPKAELDNNARLEKRATAYDRSSTVVSSSVLGRDHLRNPGLYGMGYRMGPAIKSTLITASWGAVGGAVAAIIIGFTWGGWTTSSTTQEMTEEALLASRAAICVAQFMKDPNHKEKLNEFKSSDHPLRELTNYELGKAIEKVGWDKMPGQQDAIWNVSRACADGIERLMEK